MSFHAAPADGIHLALQVETPLELAPRLSDRLGNNIYIKREDMQPVFSFKVRADLSRRRCSCDSATAAG